MTYWYPGVLEVIRMVRDIYSKTPVLLGGIYATLCDKHAKAYSGADFVIHGQGENKVLDLVGELTGSVVRCYPDAENLDSYPYPAFDLLGNLKYVCILTSRGCPFACSYCASRILYPAFRQRLPLRVVDEIEYWVERFGVRDFAFYDDALFGGIAYCCYDGCWRRQNQRAGTCDYQHGSGAIKLIRWLRCEQVDGNCYQQDCRRKPLSPPVSQAHDRRAILFGFFDKVDNL